MGAPLVSLWCVLGLKFFVLGLQFLVLDGEVSQFVNERGDGLLVQLRDDGGFGFGEGHVLISLGKIVG